LGSCKFDVAVKIFEKLVELGYHEVEDDKTPFAYSREYIALAYEGLGNKDKAL
jgi:hypothetical protein